MLARACRPARRPRSCRPLGAPAVPPGARARVARWARLPSRPAPALVSPAGRSW